MHVFCWDTGAIVLQSVFIVRKSIPTLSGVFSTLSLFRSCRTVFVMLSAVIHSHLFQLTLHLHAPLPCDLSIDHVGVLQRILTPTQTAKFVLWVSKNEACVHMLNQLWDKLHGDTSRD